MSSNEIERIMFFDHARRRAEAAYKNDPLDVNNLTSWGTALMELATFQQPEDAHKMLHESISKFEEALKVDPTSSRTLWSLGNAMMALAFLFSDAKVAARCFDKARNSFTKASEKDPSNSIFLKSLDVVAKAPELHARFHKHGKGQQGVADPTDGPSDSSSLLTRTTPKKKKSSYLKYEVLGWCILAVGIVAWGIRKERYAT